VSYYLTDGAHCLISGATGAGDDYGGKSVLANWWFQQSVERGWHDVGVFFDPKGLGYVSRSDDVRRVRTLKGLAQSYRAGYRLFDYYARATEKGPRRGTRSADSDAPADGRFQDRGPRRGSELQGLTRSELVSVAGW